MNKKAVKRLAGSCVLCNNQNAAVLDCHRWIPGRDGGRYHERNLAVLCSNCHRAEQAGQFKITGKFLCTSGKWLLRVDYPDGREEFVVC